MFYAPQIASSCKYDDSTFDPDPFTEIARDSMPNPIVKSRLQRLENGQDQIFPDKFFLPSPTLVSHGPDGYACRKCNGKVAVVEFTKTSGNTHVLLWRVAEICVNSLETSAKRDWLYSTTTRA